jgi:hypothetical protein
MSTRPRSFGRVERALAVLWAGVSEGKPSLLNPAKGFWPNASLSSPGMRSLLLMPQFIWPSRGAHQDSFSFQRRI